VSFYVVLAGSAVAAVLLTFALVREARLRRALAMLLSLILERHRRKNEARNSDSRPEPPGGPGGL
jgi:hypothetical protein